MKKITQEQCNKIVQTFFDINAPIQVYIAVKKLLDELPEIKPEIKEDKK